MVADLPRWKCHKEVQAGKIARIQPGFGLDGQHGQYLMFYEDLPSVFVTDVWVEKFHPEPAGYYVVYQDGYASYSPAEAFEGGYTRI